MKQVIHQYCMHFVLVFEERSDVITPVRKKLSL